MPRLLLLWKRPHHLSAVEADTWVREQITQLALPDSVERIELTPLSPAAGGYPSPGDWLCELHLREDADASACLADRACAEWLRDLRLLGMAPLIAIATEGIPR